MSRTEPSELAERGRRVLVLEADAIRRVAERLGPAFSAAVRLLEKATGRLIVSGVGKSGLIARKIAATLTSTGSPASFLHPVDSLHGDLGLVGREDVAILLSKSGASDELFGLVGQLKRLGVPIIALTGDPDSPLARQSDVVLDASVTEEACPETLAPTTSTTAALALGDALAVTLLEVKGFRREQFAALHPGGTLGRHLLLRVADVMLAGNVPALGPDRPMRECVVLLAEKRGTVAVVDAAGSLVGVVTAGDLTRLMERTDQFLDIPVRDVMTRTPKSTTADELAGAAVQSTHGRADTAYFHPPAQTAELRNVHITFYDTRGAETSTLTSRQGTYHWRSSDMEARGNVVVVRTDGATLRTEVIRYSQVRNQVSSDKDFVFDEPTRHIKGTGFTADPDFKVVTANRVTGEGGKFTLPNQ